jgi:hypothetical protein
VKERLGIICATQQASLDEKAQLQAGIRENWTIAAACKLVASWFSTFDVKH